MESVNRSPTEAAEAASPSPVAQPASESVPSPPLEPSALPPLKPISTPSETVLPLEPQEHSQQPHPQYVESNALTFIGEDGQDIICRNEDIESGVSEAPNGVQPDPAWTDSKMRSGLQPLQNMSLDGILDKLFGAEQEDPTHPSALYTAASSTEGSIAESEDSESEDSESEDSDEHASEVSSVCAVILYFAAGLLGGVIMTNLTVLYGLFRVFRDVPKHGTPLGKNVSFLVGALVGVVAVFVILYHPALVRSALGTGE